MTTNFPRCPVNKRSRDAELRLERQKYDKAELQVHHFLWSWPEPACETSEEFLLSNFLFLMFLDSKEFADAMRITRQFPRFESTEVARACYLYQIARGEGS